MDIKTSSSTLADYLRQYGEVVDCVIVMDRENGWSRGFGFVTFKNAIDRDKCLHGSNTVDGRKVNVLFLVR